MAQPRAQQFVDALHRLETDRDLEDIVSLFGDDAELANPNIPDSLRGTDGAREFWHTYRDTFGEIFSEFHHVLEGEGAAMLEWTSRGTTTNGGRVEYDGVTVIEFGDRGVRRFRAYFDPARLGEQIEPGR